MNLRNLLTSLASVCALGASSGVLGQFVDPAGDDTDIFLANPTISATRPNVVILLDNTANWNTPFATEKQALINIANSLITDAFNVGLAMFVETGGGNDSQDGAYMRFAVRQMTPTNKARFTTVVNGLDIVGDKSNNAVPGLAMGELYRYFAGLQAVSGLAKLKRDYWGNTTYNPFAADLPGNAFVSSTSTTYVSPIVSGCQKNFIIYISNGKGLENAAALSAAQSHLTSLMGQSPTMIPLTPSGEQGNWGDEYAKYMASNDCAPAVDGMQNVLTYTLDVLPAVAGSPDWTALLQSMANNGKGRYFAITDTSTTQQFEDALRAIFQEVQAVNSVFASVALPVSLNVRGSNLNQVYIGQFRPDVAKSPRWFGNLKMYKIGADSSGALFLAGADGNRAENAATGFISPNARSFWTAGSTFWNHRSADENGTGGASDLPDGDLVEKGGAGQRLRTRHGTDQDLRQMYTCVSSSGFCSPGDLLSASPFDVSNANITAGDMGSYLKFPVQSITSELVGTTPTATATVLFHGFTTGDIVKITGASPTVYNQSASITVVDSHTFTYVLPSLPPANVAEIVTPVQHKLVSGDQVEVILASPTAYNVGGASVTVTSDTKFQYPMSGSSTLVAGGAYQVFGKKLAVSVSGAGTSATATVLNHGYSNGDIITIEGATDPAFNRVNAVISNVTANSFDYTTTVPIAGTANTARVISPTHGFSSGQTVTVTGSSEALFNGSFPITKVDANTFVYAVSGSANEASNAGMVASIDISQITHPTTGSGPSRDVATVTTSVSHGFTDGQVVIISNTGGAPPAGYDGSYTISGATATSFTITHASIDTAPTPKTTAGMRAGRTVTQILPVVQASGTIRSKKQINVTSISSKANATGFMLAGRPLEPLDADPADRAELIRWVRGRDNYENEKSNVPTPDVRPSVHGDVLHSRPAVVNYGRGSTEDDVYLFYGTNDGGLRAVKGGAAVVAGDNHPNNDPVQPGDERWTFIPKEVMGKFDRLRTRSPEISSDNPRDYFVDGPVSAYTKDVNNDGKLLATDGDKVYVYFTMRRGGDFIYALDVSNPGAPRFLWRKQAGDTGYGEVGQTWSEAKVTRVKANARPSETPPGGNPDNLVLVMGAGYDPAVEDAHPCLTDRSDATSIRKIVPAATGSVSFHTVGTCTVTGPTPSTVTVSRTKGRGIMVIDALDGHVIWQAGPAPSGATHNVTVPEMTYAIASDIHVADVNGDGFGDMAYVGDTGGNVWRLDFTDTDPAKWSVRRVATLASSSPTDIANKRKFLFAPEVVVAQDALGLFSAVLLGSGDREHPFDGIVVNRFYMLKDRGEADTLGSLTGNRSYTQTTVTTTSTGGGATGKIIQEADLFDATNTVGASDSGWMRTLGPGEKIVSSALAFQGTAMFSSNQPTVLAGAAVDACASNLGVARIYSINVANGEGTAVIRPGGGYIPSTSFAAVALDGNGGQSTTTTSDGACTGAACGNQSTSGGNPGDIPNLTPVCLSGMWVEKCGTLDVGSRRRAYWYKEID